MTDLDPESRHVLELAAAARTPSSGDKARVAQRLDAAIGIATGASGTHAAAGHGSAAIKGGGAALIKWIAAAAIVAAAVAAYVATSSRAIRETPHPSTPAQTAPVPAPSAAEEPTQPAAPAPALAPAPQAQSPRTPHRVEHRHPAAADDSPQDEVGLLHRAQAAWRAQDAATALALLDEHRTRYPHSQLAPERDALQALSLCDLGKRDEGRRLARSVIARAPHSPLRASLEQSCALK
jgi:hypothetical protein